MTRTFSITVRPTAQPTATPAPTATPVPPAATVRAWINAPANGAVLSAMPILSGGASTTSGNLRRIVVMLGRNRNGVVEFWWPSGRPNASHQGVWAPWGPGQDWPNLFGGTPVDRSHNWNISAGANDLGRTTSYFVRTFAYNTSEVKSHEVQHSFTLSVAQPQPSPTARPAPTATPRPVPTATPRPVPTATPLPVVTSIVLSVDKSAICAGALNSPVHQATVTATVRDQRGAPMNGRSVLFRWNPPGPMPEVQFSAVTNTLGQARAYVTSGDEVGSMPISAQCESRGATTSVSVMKPSAAWNVNPQNLIADGRQTAQVSVTLTMNGQGVPSHRLAWSIARARPQGSTTWIYPNAQGVIPGFGHFAGSSSTTNPSGVASNVFTVGTRAGTVSFQVVDVHWYEASAPTGQSLQTMQAGRRPGTFQQDGPIAPAPVPPTRVSFVGTLNRGYDNTGAVPTLNVPLPGSNAVEYNVTPREQIGALSFEHGSVITKRTESLNTTQGPAVGRFIATGVRPGSTVVRVLANGQRTRQIDSESETALQVEVRRQRLVNVNFYLVEDGTHTTGKSTYWASQFTGGMNNIFTPQANVVFEQKNVRVVRVPRSLGPVVNINELAEVVAAKNALPPGAPVTGEVRNVFFVWALESGMAGFDQGDPNKDPDSEGALIGENVFVSVSTIAQITQTICHELGHSFGLEHPGKLVWVNGRYTDPPSIWRFRDRLMYPIVQASRQRLTREEANRINPTP